MTVSGVYQIENQINGNCYVGSAVNFRNRWRSHLSALHHNRHENQHLQRAFNRYGEAAFSFSILEHIKDALQLIPREQHYLDTLRPEYNIKLTAGRGGRPSLATRRKLSEALSKRWLNDEYRQKMRDAVTGECNSMYGKGRPRSEETKRKISEGRKGQSLTEETKRKLSIAQKAHWRRVRGAMQLSDEGEENG